MASKKNSVTKKGNYVKTGEVIAARKEITEQARKLAKAKREASPYSPAKQGIFIERLNNYIEEKKASGEPMTVAGFILASGIPQASWYHLKDGDFDNMIEEFKITNDIPLDADEWVTEDGEILSLKPWSEIIEHCYLMAQEQREIGCIKGKAGNVVGNIFLLKSQHGLSDQPDMIKTQNNIQIVADAEMALKALEMCK